MSPSTRWFAWIGGALLLAMVGARFGTGASLDPPDVVPVGVFSEMDPSQALPEEWQPLTLAAAYKKTAYDLVQSDRGTVLRARSDGSSSALATECRIDVSEHPILEWRWKVDGVVKKGKAGVKSRDDYSARIIVTFDYRDLSLAHRLKVVAFRALGYDFVPRRSLTYLWGNRAERGRVFPNPYAEWMKHVVVRSGSTHVGTWQTERRNVRADYRAIYGDDPPPLTGIGVMTDTDNTNGSATAYYGDIVFRRAVPDSATVDTTLRRTNDNPEHQ